MIKKILILWGSMTGLVFIVMFLCFQVIPKFGEKRGEAKTEEIDNKAESINVYMYGDETTNLTTGESFYSSGYALGEFDGRTQVWGNEGHIFYSAIQDFEKRTAIDVNITFFLTTWDILEQLKKDVEQDTLPDVIIGSYASEDYNLTPFLLNDYFYDLTPFFEEDEMISGGKYVSKVMEAGQINGKQMLFPLTFNMNLLMTSKETLQKHSFPILRDYTYDEMVKLFTEEWSNQGRESDELLLAQHSDMWDTFPYVLFDGASGISCLDLEEQKINLDQEYFMQLTDLYKAYYLDDFNMSQEELKAMAAGYHGSIVYKKSKFIQLTNRATEEILGSYDYMRDHIVCIADGGTQGFSLHSFAAQASYYESRFRDHNEEFLCIGIPTKEDKDKYTAIVTIFGGVMKNSQHAKEGYEFLKSLADYPHFMYMDLSVNKERIQDTFDEYTSTYFDFYPAQGGFPPEDVPEGENWLGECYQIQPMSEETRRYLEEMIERIGVAILPEGIPRQVVQTEVERYIYGDLDTAEEAYENAIDGLEEMLRKDGNT